VKDKQPGAEEKRGAPAWLISFTDMITLLLSFFILLQAFAKVRDPELFYAGQGGFQRAISRLGLPDWLFGQPERIRLKYLNQKHPMEEDTENEYPLQVIDAQDEKIRKLFQELRRLRRTEVGDQWGRPAQWLATPIRFGPSGIDLHDAGKEFLRDLARDLRHYGGSGAPRVSVIGLAPDATTPRDRWTLSARRASVVEAFLTSLLRKELNHRGVEIDSWGGGAGEHWYGAPEHQQQQAFIVLALMQAQAEE